ncbi:MAG: hypothetical protein H7Y60_16065 [Rhodospirillaceae bacterium]|nr:hypothetical protein [Rhodospirillales bacterium]
MQFRERSRVIQVIRTIYDPAIKRGRAEVVARLDKDDPQLDDDVRSACSPDELAEVETFLTERAEMMSREATRDAAEDLAARMRMAEAYFRSGPDGIAGTLAAEIFTAWDDLKKAMHRAGFRKEKHDH